MVVTNVHIDPSNKWLLVIIGTENNKAIKTYCTIPPTTGNRVDIITSDDLEAGYRYDVSIIVINIISGIANIHLFK